MSGSMEWLADVARLTAREERKKVDSTPKRDEKVEHRAAARALDALADGIDKASSEGMA